MELLGILVNCATQMEDKQGLKNPGKNQSGAGLDLGSVSQWENGFLLHRLSCFFWI